MLLVSYPKKIISKNNVKGFSPMLSQGFIVPSLTFRFSINFVLNIVRYGSTFILLNIQFSQLHLLSVHLYTLNILDFLVKYLSTEALVCFEALNSFIYVNVFVPVQFSSVAQLCLTLCDPVNRNTAGLPVHHQLPEFIPVAYCFDSYSSVK